MSETDHVAEAPAGEQMLDPFSYHPGKASAIRGLGGAEPDPDPAYAFHTDYVSVAEGPCHFTVRFEGLEAKLGTLLLRVHMYVDVANPRVLLSNSLRIQFNRLLLAGGETSIRFDGFHGVKFGLYGAVLGETDALATGLSVTLDRPLGAMPLDNPAAELRNSSYGQDATRAEPTLITLAPPTLAAPVAQAGTSPQLREPVFRDWAAQLDLKRAPDRTRWAAAYVLQALRTYGMLQPGAAGLAFAAEPAPVAHAIERLGIRCEAAALPDTAEALPGPLVNFDFLWTIDMLGADGVAGAATLGEALMRCLRPGGIAVHVLPFLPGLAQRAPEGETAATFRRGDVERLALTMISRKFEAAQLKIDHGRAILDQAGVGAFGMVFRKPPFVLD